MNDVRSLFERLLVSLWLRPERALWDAHELATVRSMLGPTFARPALEYGCTDGMNTFVMAGGEVKFDHDDYEDIAGLALDVAGGSDYFAKANDIARPVVHRTPSYRFDVGITWRDSHLERASRLGIYNELKCVALGAAIPVASRSLATIWAPNLFWNERGDLPAMLAELARALRKDGRIILIMPDAEQAKAEIWSKLAALPEPFIRALDRGTAKNLTMNALGDDQWQKIFAEAGLSVTDHRRFLPSIVGTIYQIGFRPMFPALMEAYTRLRRGNLAGLLAVKRQWIETVLHFMGPLCDPALGGGMAGPYLWHAYELRHG